MREAIAICQSLPGPLAIQIGIYISYRAGAWAGGWAFILPNFVIVAAHRLASAQRYGNAWLKTGAAQGQLVCFAARTIVQVMFRQYFCRTLPSHLVERAGSHAALAVLHTAV